MAVLLLITALAFAVAACGDQAEEEATVVEDRPAPPASDFPSAEGRTLGAIVDQADPPDPLDPVVTAGAEVHYAGEPGGSRYPIYVTNRDRIDLTEAEVAAYAAPIPGGRRGSGSAYEQPARGPFTARMVSLATDPEHRSEPPAEDHRFASSFYLTRVPFTHAGDWRVVVLVRHDGKLTSSTMPTVLVGQYEGIPRPGQPAPPISTPTVDDVGGDRSELSTREPPSTLNDVDFREVLGEKPVALLFASPEFCQSRVCGPVVDVAEQVEDRVGDRIEFIHMEIYNENDPSEGVRPQVRAYNLPSEPWLFVVDENGIVRTAIEGAFGVNELTRAVMEVRSSNGRE